MLIVISSKKFLQELEQLRTIYVCVLVLLAAVQIFCQELRIDDFEDNDLINYSNGQWIAIGTETGIRATTAKVLKGNDSAVLNISGIVSTNDHKNWAGVKTTFFRDGAPLRYYMIKSVLFDLRSRKPVTISVEFEQSSITDGAFHAVSIPVTTSYNHYQLNMSDFKQPDWKTCEKDLDFSEVTSIRFTNYDSTGSFNLYLDNVVINIAPIVKNIITISSNDYRNHGMVIRQTYSRGTLYSTFHRTFSGTFSTKIFNINGTNVMTRSFNGYPGREISYPLTNLPSGKYLVVNTINGKPAGNQITFSHLK